MRRPGRLDHIALLGIGFAVMDIVADGVIEEHRVLRHDADGAAQRGLGEITDVGSIDTHRTPGNVVETVEKPRKRRFAGTRVPHHRHLAPGRYLEGHVEKDLALGVIGKIDMIEADRCRPARQIARMGPVGHFAVFLQQAKHPVHVDQ